MHILKVVVVYQWTELIPVWSLSYMLVKFVVKNELILCNLYTADIYIMYFNYISVLSLAFVICAICALWSL
jgi:hypothetical protein